MSVMLLMLPLHLFAESYVFKYDGDVSLSVDVELFDIKTNTYRDCGGGQICIVNNGLAWGNDGQIPVTFVKSITVQLGGKTISLDASGMYDSGITGDSREAFQIEHYYADAWKVRGRFSDGAGTYYAEWFIQQQWSSRILIGDSELLHDAFEQVLGRTTQK